MRMGAHSKCKAHWNIYNLWLIQRTTVPHTVLCCATFFFYYFEAFVCLYDINIENATNMSTPPHNPHGLKYIIKNAWKCRSHTDKRKTRSWTSKICNFIQWTLGETAIVNRQSDMRKCIRMRKKNGKNIHRWQWRRYYLVFFLLFAMKQRWKCYVRNGIRNYWGTLTFVTKTKISATVENDRIRHGDPLFKRETKKESSTQAVGE